MFNITLQNGYLAFHIFTDSTFATPNAFSPLFLLSTVRVSCGDSLWTNHPLRHVIKVPMLRPLILGIISSLSLLFDFLLQQYLASLVSNLGLRALLAFIPLVLVLAS
jgi:hypothetical protein